MSDELIIEQPQGGLWLSPGKRVGHLVAIFNCSAKEMRYDEMSQKDKEVALFEFVDLDQERDLISGLDNHPGVTNKLKVGNVAAVLGRISTVASKAGQQDAIVLGEHSDADAARLREWHASYGRGKRSGPATPAQVMRPTEYVNVPAERAQTQVPAPVAAAGAPAMADVIAGLDPGTLELLMKAAAQKAGSQ